MMQTTIRIPPTSTPGPASEPAPAPAPSSLLGRYARLSVIIAAMFSLATIAASVATLFQMLDGGFLAALDAATGVCLWGLALSWFAGGLGGGILTGWLEIWIPYRNERDDRIARKPVTETIYQTLDLPPAERFRLVGWELLTEWQLRTPELTREQAVDARLCTQTEWNVWASIWKKYGFRTDGNQWVADRQEESLYYWDATHFDLSEREKGILTARLSGGVTMRFDLGKKGAAVK